MISAEKVNEILGIKESYELPDRLMELLFSDKCQRIVNEFRGLEEDLSYDWFSSYFQEEHSNRKAMMQDFTPKELCSLLPALDGDYETVADICAGTGGLTIAMWNHNKNARFYCEELSNRAIPILILNMLIRNIDAIIVNKDILTGEIFAAYETKCGSVKRISDVPEDISVDVAVTNPPYSVKFKFEKDDERYKDYGVPPNQFSDYAFIIHAMSLINDSGSVLAILPHGILFRANREYEIRKNIINKKQLSAVIGMPDKMFRHAGIPVCVCVFKNNSDDVLLVDASKDFDKKNKYNVITHESIKKISGCYHERKEIDKYSHLAEKDEISKNDYNLNIPRYVDTYEREEIPELHTVMNELASLDVEIYKQQKELIRQMRQLTSEDVSKRKELKESIDMLENAMENRSVQLELKL